jgi:hypothetical protein
MFKKNLSQCLFCSHQSRMERRDMNPGLYILRRTTNRVSYGTIQAAFVLKTFSTLKVLVRS